MTGRSWRNPHLAPRLQLGTDGKLSVKGLQEWRKWI